MTTRRARFAFFVAAALLAAARPAAAADARCPEGLWTIDGGPITVGPVDIAFLQFRDGDFTIHRACRTMRWAVRPADGGAELRALFACRSPEDTRRGRRFALRLRARIADGCATLAGGFAVRRLGEVIPFAATRTGGACAAHDDCAPEAYCMYPVGACAGPGTCAARPVDCLFGTYAYVCGCDGVTYDWCSAQMLGVNLSDYGACRTTCGGITGIPCPGGEFCDLPAGQCGGTDLEGRCVDVTDACPEFYAPVCGCDGVTYANECFRQAAQVQKDHDGACAETCTPKTAACTTACDCYAALGTAFCDDCPLLCPNCGDYWQCKDGACVEQCGMLPPEVQACLEPPQCGGIAGIPCPAGQVCDLGFIGCDVADAAGECVPRGTCTLQYDPVCGCDGKTYGNDCERRQNGVGLAHLGRCDGTRVP